MEKNAQNISVGWLMIIVSSILILAYIFFLIENIDFFVNKKDVIADVLSQRDSKDGSGYVFEVKYQNDYKNAIVKDRMFVKFSKLDNYQKRRYTTLEVVYTKWIKQLYMKDADTPAVTIFLFDFIMIFIFGLCFKVGKRMTLNSVSK